MKITCGCHSHTLNYVIDRLGQFCFVFASSEWVSDKEEIQKIMIKFNIYGCINKLFSDLII